MRGAGGGGAVTAKANKVYSTVRVGGWSSIVVLLILSGIIGNEIYLLLFSDPLYFQRFGGLIVAVCIIWFVQMHKMAAKAEELAAEQAEIGVGMHLAHRGFRKAILVYSISRWISIWGAIVGTLQASYGDIFHCWINGYGVSPCGI